VPIITASGRERNIADLFIVFKALEIENIL